MEKRKPNFGGLSRCLLSVIWKERNKIIFEDAVFFLDKLKSFCAHLAWLIWSERLLSKIRTCIGRGEVLSSNPSMDSLLHVNKVISCQKKKKSFCNYLFYWACVYSGLDLSLAGCISHYLWFALRVGKIFVSPCFFAAFLLWPFSLVYILYTFWLIYLWSLSIKKLKSHNVRFMQTTQLSKYRYGLKFYISIVQVNLRVPIPLYNTNNTPIWTTWNRFCASNWTLS